MAFNVQSYSKHSIQINAQSHLTWWTWYVWEKIPCIFTFCLPVQYCTFSSSAFQMTMSFWFGRQYPHYISIYWTKAPNILLWIRWIAPRITIWEEDSSGFSGRMVSSGNQNILVLWIIYLSSCIVQQRKHLRYWDTIAKIDMHRGLLKRHSADPTLCITWWQKHFAEVAQ
jgi:hypothetical protein